MIQPYNHLKAIINPRKNVLGIWIEPVEDAYIPAEIKQCAKKAKVAPCRIPGYWYHRKGQPLIGEARAAPNEQVIYYIHGGGFIHQSAHPADQVSPAPTGTLKALHNIKRLLAVEYRLSTGEPVAPTANPFPAALLDVISGYVYLVKVLKFDTKNIVLAGDSCGANLALALTRCIRELQNPSLGMPKALILYSPWVDPGDSHTTENSSVIRNGHIDYGSLYVKDMWATEVYTAPFEKNFHSTNPYVSPASKKLPKELQKGLFKGFPRTLVFAGDREQLIDSMRTFRDKMQADIGKDLTYVETKDAVHDVILYHWYQPERNEIIQKVSEWFSALN